MAFFAESSPLPIRPSHPLASSDLRPRAYRAWETPSAPPSLEPPSGGDNQPKQREAYHGPPPSLLHLRSNGILEGFWKPSSVLLSRLAHAINSMPSHGRACSQHRHMEFGEPRRVVQPSRPRSNRPRRHAPPSFGPPAPTRPPPDHPSGLPPSPSWPPDACRAGLARRRRPPSKPSRRAKQGNALRGLGREGGRLGWLAVP